MSHAGDGPGSKVSIGASECQVPARCVLDLEKLPPIL